MYAFSFSFFVFSIAMSIHNDAFQVIEVGCFPLASLWLCIHLVEKEMQSTPAFLPGKSHKRVVWQAIAHRVTKESDIT